MAKKQAAAEETFHPIRRQAPREKTIQAFSTCSNRLVRLYQNGSKARPLLGQPGQHDGRRPAAVERIGQPMQPNSPAGRTACRG